MTQNEGSRRDSSSSRCGFDSTQDDPRLEAFEALGAAAAVLDTSGRIIAINRGFRRLVYAIGYLGRDSGVGEKFLDVCALAPGHDAVGMADVTAGLRRVLEAEIDSIKVDCVSPLGAEAQACRMIISSLREGERRGAAVLVLDISDRATQEAELERSLSLLRATLESTADGILVVDAAGKIASFNQRFVDMWSIPEEIVASRDDDRAIVFVLDQLVDPGVFVSKVRELYADPDAESFDILTFKDGRTLERYSKPQRLRGRSVGRVWSFRDVTGRKRTEEALRRSEDQFRHAQKMEAIGRLAGGVAHDFNNLMTAILGYSDLLLTRIPPGDPISRDLEDIRRAGERAAALTHQLLAFSRRQVLQAKVLDLNMIIADLEKMMRRVIGEDIELVTILAPDLGHVRVDPGQVEQVIMNLAVNARDAMPSGGRLTIETRNGGSGSAIDRGPLSDDPCVDIVVTDTGIGMDAATRSHVFEPFFTTKEMGKGTGLGLATVYGIVTQSGGSIHVDSEPGQGTAFSICLPRVFEPLERRPATGRNTSTATGTETILVVEDEEVVRTLVHEILERNGYEVLVAGNGLEALRLCENQLPAIDLVLTDVVMPGISGPTLAERLAGLRPGLKVVFMSGYASADIFERGGTQPSAPVLDKPFTADALLSFVRDLLDEFHRGRTSGPA